MSLEHQEFLTSVETYVKKHPDVAPLVTQATSLGLSMALTSLRQQLADFETAAAVLASVRYKDRDSVLRDKLLKWKGQTALRWDWLMDKLEPPVPSALQEEGEAEEDQILRIVADLAHTASYPAIDSMLSVFDIQQVPTSTLNGLVELLQPKGSMLKMLPLFVEDVRTELQRRELVRPS